MVQNTTRRQRAKRGLLDKKKRPLGVQIVPNQQRGLAARDLLRRIEGLRGWGLAGGSLGGVGGWVWIVPIQQRGLAALDLAGELEAVQHLQNKESGAAARGGGGQMRNRGDFFVLFLCFFACHGSIVCHRTSGQRGDSPVRVDRARAERGLGGMLVCRLSPP